MKDKSTIQFEEISDSASDFVHEFNDPDMLRNRRIPPSVSVEIRRQQVARLKANIGVLVKKREEFNSKMEDYIQNLSSLLRSVEKRISTDEDKLAADADTATLGVTHVRCLACECEAVFENLQVLFGRESNDSFTRPTEVYVLDEGRIRKGHFACSSCGKESLVIRAGS